MNAFKKGMAFALVCFAAGCYWGSRETAKKADLGKRMEQLAGPLSHPKSGSLSIDANAGEKTPGAGDSLNKRLSTLLAQKDYVSLDIALRAWAKTDLRSAIAWCESLKGTLRNAALVPVLASWLETAPAEAFAWAKQNDREFFETSAFMDYGTMIGHAGQALEGLQLVASKATRLALLSTLGCRLGETEAGRKDVFHFDTLSDIDNRSAFYKGLVQGWAVTDPASAFQFASTVSTTSEGRNELVTNAVRGWVAGGGIDEAKQFLLDQPRSKDFLGAYREIASALAKTSPEQVYDWIVATTDDPGTRSFEVYLLFGGMARTRPELASQLATLSDNSDSLEKRLSSSLPLWSAKDPDAANRFLTDLGGLDDKAKERLRALLATP